MAASGGLVEEFCEETTCPICLDHFAAPVILDCGHNFCRACLTQCWGGEEEDPSREACCPQCRAPAQQGQLRPNRQLANVVELVKKLEEGKGEGAGGKRRRGSCPQHQEPLKLFCKDHQAPICVVCDRASEHQGHGVLPIEEAAKEFKEQIQAQLQSLEKERDILVEQKLTEELKSQNCVTQVGAEKEKIRSTSEHMQKLLEEKKCLWLGQLDDLEKEIERKREENDTKFAREISHLSNLITEMQEKCKEPASEFLQDIRSTLTRYQKTQVRQLLDNSPDLEERLRSYSQKSSVLKKAMEEFKESLQRTPNKETLEQTLNKVNVTLDPDTAHPSLILSEDLKSVRKGDIEQDLPNNPERFDTMFCVLGHEIFTSGRHSWEVELEEKKGALWAMGVAKETLKRKEGTNLNPAEGIWAVGKDSLPCQLWAFTSPEWTVLNWSYQPKKIRVFLDYEEGQVEFFDADIDELIFSFHSASFSGERIRPFFWLWSGVQLNC